jgi:CubicO group peptidase (beta-lactamase class C family)
MITTPRLSALGAAVAAVIAASAPVLPSSAIAPADAAARRVDDYLTRLVPHGLSGAVLVARNGQVVLKKGYGLANRATGLAYSADMPSCIGSVTKQFTGAAIVKLEMEGRLATSDPIAKHLPGVPADKAGVTIHHLLTHTAGLPGDLGGGDEEPIERDELVAKVLAAPLASTPGERFEYSNEGYSLAGAIIERVSGMGYEQYLRERLWLPAGMRETGYLLPEWPLASLPLGYGEDGREWGRVFRRGWLSDGPGWYLRANGGVHATLDDLYRWHVALGGGSLLSAEALRKYQTGHVDSPGGNERYAYGWGIETTRRGTRVIAHNGGNGFFFTDFRRYVDEDVVVIAMTNQPVIRATELAVRQLESLVFADGPAPIVPPSAVDVSLDRRNALAGVYRLDDGGVLTVRASARGLEAEASDPMLFSASSLTPPGTRFADLESRTRAILERASQDDFRPLVEAFDDDRPFELIQRNQRRFWGEWRERFGAFERVEVLGTGRADGDPAVTVRLRFARGGPVLQFIWGPRRLAGWRALPPASQVTLLAESPATWAYYSYRLPNLIKVTFEDGGSVRLTRGSTEMQGRRAEP